MGARSVLSLCLVLVFDGVAFVLLTSAGEAGGGDLLIGGLIGKTLAGLIYGSMLWGYVRLVGEEARSEARLPVRPTRRQTCSC